MGSPIIQSYLILYNIACAAGWFYVLYLSANCALRGDPAYELWYNIRLPLMAVQSSMGLEIFHSLFGFVRSPFLVTLMQVASRLNLIWGYTYWVPECQGHWSLYLMAISWSITEVIRYLFYVTTLVVPSKNFHSAALCYPIFFLRYSTFLVLYPTGITGEVLQMLFSMPHYSMVNPIFYRLTTLTLAIYLPGSPFMVFNMWKTRQSAFKKRKMSAGAVKKPVPLGVAWPVTDQSTGERSTSLTNKKVWEAAIGGLASVLDEEDYGYDVVKAAKESIDRLSPRKWRFGYVRHVIQNVRASLMAPEYAVTVAKAGLKHAYTTFMYRSKGGEGSDGAKEVPMMEAMKDLTTSHNFLTCIIKGNGTIGSGSGGGSRSPELTLLYGGSTAPKGLPYYAAKAYRDRPIKNRDLLDQIDEWGDYGVMEKDTAEALKDVVLNQSAWLDLSDLVFVLLGATSAMGPLDFLLEYGGNIVAVDLNRPQIWSRLIQKVLNSNGSLIFPVLDTPEGRKMVDAINEVTLSVGAGASKIPMAERYANALGSETDSAWIDDLAQLSGSNLLGQCPEIASWVAHGLMEAGPDQDLLYKHMAVVTGQDQKSKVDKAKFVVGNYTYLDGALHVQLALACDWIMNAMCEVDKDTTLAFLCTPTDCHVINQGAYQTAKENYRSTKGRPSWQRMVQSLCELVFGRKKNRILVPNLEPPVPADRTAANVGGEGGQYYYVDGLVSAQGPNYALAKRIQHWRAVVAYTRGHRVSSNVAPSTATASVVHNAQFAAAYGCFHLFKPLEVAYQELSVRSMAALLIYDIRSKNSKSAIANNPDGGGGSGDGSGAVANPLTLFSFTSFHGGVWRSAYKVGSIGEVSASIFYLETYKLSTLVAVAGMATLTFWIITGYTPVSF